MQHRFSGEQIAPAARDALLQQMVGVAYELVLASPPLFIVRKILRKKVESGSPQHLPSPDSTVFFYFVVLDNVFLALYINTNYCKFNSQN